MAKKKRPTEDAGRPGRPRSRPPTDAPTPGTPPPPPPDTLHDMNPDELQTLWDRIRTALGVKPPETGRTSIAYGPDPNDEYEVRYELRELNDLITSNTLTGAVNPDYPQELQPRDRTRMASNEQIDEIIRRFKPEGYLVEFHSLDRGAPIVGPDNAVESGNGRTMALRLLAAEQSEKYHAYREQLTTTAAAMGIDPREVERMETPILVRVRQTDVDRIAFTEGANARAGMGMSDTERARSDARRISATQLSQFESTENIDADLQRAANRPFVRTFFAALPRNERSEMMTAEGAVNQTGVKRLKAAMFTHVYDDPALSDRIFESTDNDIRNITNGMMNSLGRLARSEELIRTGQRGADLSIAGDVAAAVRTYASIKSQGKMSVDEYLSQGQMFGSDLSPTQQRILKELSARARSGKQVSELLTNWAELVERQPDPRQSSLIPAAGRDELINTWLNTRGNAAHTLF